MVAHVPGVPLEVLSASECRAFARLFAVAAFVGAHRVEEADDRHLRVDDDVLAAGQPNHEVGPLQPVGRAHRMLLVEVAVLDHAGELDHLAQLVLAPRPARLRRAKGRHELPRLVLELRGRLAHLVDLGTERGVGIGAFALDVLHLLFDVCQRLFQRRDEQLDRLLALLQIADDSAVTRLMSSSARSMNAVLFLCRASDDSAAKASRIFSCESRSLSRRSWVLARSASRVADRAATRPAVRARARR